MRYRREDDYRETASETVLAIASVWLAMALVAFTVKFVLDARGH